MLIPTPPATCNALPETVDVEEPVLLTANVSLSVVAPVTSNVLFNVVAPVTSNVSLSVVAPAISNVLLPVIAPPTHNVLVEVVAPLILTVFNVALLTTSNALTVSLPALNPKFVSTVNSPSVPTITSLPL